LGRSIEGFLKLLPGREGKLLRGRERNAKSGDNHGKGEEPQSALKGKRGTPEEKKTLLGSHGFPGKAKEGSSVRRRRPLR